MSKRENDRGLITNELKRLNEQAETTQRTQSFPKVKSKKEKVKRFQTIAALEYKRTQRRELKSI